MSKKLIKFLLVFGFLVLAMAAVVILRPVDSKAVAADPTATPTKPPAPTATPVPFTGKADVVAMYPAMGDINMDTARPKGIAAPRGDDPTKSFVVFSPGTNNVPVGVPVYVQAGAISLADKATVKDYAWTVKGPADSKAAIAKLDKPQKGLSADMASFTPDKEGVYTVGIVLTDSAGAKSVAGELKVVAAKYMGNDVCKGCHADQYEKWSKTAHGTAFARYVTMNVEAEYWSAGFGCARCHTVGYYPVPGTGGWWDTFVNVAKMNWTKGEFVVKSAPDKDGKVTETKYNSLAEAIAFNGNPDAEVGGDVYNSLPAQVKSMSNIGCESCHGPASAHVAFAGANMKDPEKVKADVSAPATGADSSSCMQCHNASGHHTRGGAVMNSKHEENASLEEGNRKPCNACHSAEGFVDTAAGVAADKTRAIDSNIGCATCHDPHDATNTFQLRMVNNVTIPTAKITDAGLSAVCMSCHNNRTDVNDPKTGAAGAVSYPHYSSAAEQLAGVGGYTFGATLQNGYHMNIGKAPITDEAGTVNNGGVAPGSCVLCHMSVTPGGVWDTKESLVIPGHQTVGGHTFAMSDGKTESVAVCQQCHPGVKDFNFTLGSDYDGNGKPEGAQTEIKNLLDMTWNAINTKAAAEKITITKMPSYPYYQLKSTDPAVKTATPSTELKAAIYNYRYVYGLMWSGDNIGGYGKAAAIHNFQRSAGLLQVTIEKMTGKPLSTDAKTTLLYTLPKKK